MGQYNAHPMEEVANLPELALYRYHNLLVELYGDHLHHNNGTHLDRGAAANSL